MNDISRFFSGNHFIDVVIALAVLEGMVLVAYHRICGRGIAPRDFVLNLLSGLCLMLALRFALANVGWPWVTLCLSAAGLAHAADMGQRWARQRRQL